MIGISSGAYSLRILLEVPSEPGALFNDRLTRSFKAFLSDR